MSEKDIINHPSHYISNEGLETIDVIDAFTAELQGTDAVYTGHILRYVCRWPYKNGTEDLKKARWYLDRLINKLEQEEDMNLEEPKCPYENNNVYYQAAPISCNTSS